MDNFKRFLRSFTSYQKWYLIIVFAITLGFVIFFPDLMLEDSPSKFVMAASVIAVLANPVCELMISKQSRYNFAVDFFLIEICELTVCLYNGWYSIAMVTVLFWMPIDIVSWLRWE